MSSADAVNRLPAGTLQERLLECCGSERFVSAVASGRPYADHVALEAAAMAALDAFRQADWLEALRAEAGPVPAGGDDGTRAATATALDLYRQRFGYGFILANDDVPADELLMRIRIRLGNETDAELRGAAEELRRAVLTRVRRLGEE